MIIQDPIFKYLVVQVGRVYVSLVLISSVVRRYENLTPCFSINDRCHLYNCLPVQFGGGLGACRVKTLV